MQAVLVENQMPASYKLSLKLYYSTFPLLSVFHIQNTVTACINAFTNDPVEYSYHRLHGFQEQIDSRPLFEMESLDYDELYRRYDMENHFLKMIDSAIYQNPAISLSMVCELAEAVRMHRLHYGSYSAPIQKIVEYLDLNYSQEISFAHLADMAHFSEAHLSKTFKKETGATITQHIMQIRCKKAAQLLKDTDLSVQEISRFVGYLDNNYFVKVFKKQYGLTPTAFRAPAHKMPHSDAAR